MGKRKNYRFTDDSLIGEHGTIFKKTEISIALGYPGTYKIMSSSLGAGTIYRLFNEQKNISCERFFFPDSQVLQTPAKTAESGRFVSHCQMIAFSISCETHLLQVVKLLKSAGLQPLSQNRDSRCPPVVIGGPLTFVDPRLAAPLADVVVAGEGENSIKILCDALLSDYDKDSFLKSLPNASLGIWVPSICKTPPDISFTPQEQLPAFAATWSPKSELKNLFLVEAARGCPNACTFCVMSAGSVNCGKYRWVEKQDILDKIPRDALEVGLVGANLTAHPQIEDIAFHIASTGKRISLSSVRADKLSLKLLKILAESGLKTITVAADGSSQRLREKIRKKITADDLIRAATYAKETRIKKIRLYSMLGLPDETDEDVMEFCELLIKLSKIISVTLAIQTFVPKPGTPLKDAPFAPLKIIRNRIKLIKKQTKGKIHLSSTSYRWSWLDWQLVTKAEKAALIAIRANDYGGDFAGWKRALS